MLKASAQDDLARRRFLALLAVPLALAASAAIALPCAYMSESGTVGTPGGVEVVTRGCVSLLEHSRGAVLFFVGPPLFLAFVGALAAILGSRRGPLIAGVLILSGSVVVTVFSFAQFPLYFAPAGACLLAAGVSTPHRVAPVA